MTYLLLALVVGVWTVVIRRIVSHAAPEAARAVQQPVPPASGSERAERPLSLDYRDPFETEAPPVRPPRAPSSATAAPTLAEEPEPEPPPLRYQGMIRQDGRMYALLEHEGTSALLQRNDTLASMRVLLIATDSVVLQRGRKRFTLFL